MKEELIKKIVPAFEDDRGAIFDILDGVEICHIGMITSKAGAIRGNHYHKLATQYIYVLDGTIEVDTADYVEEKPPQNQTKCIMRKGDLTVHKPMQIHSVKSIGDSTILVFTTHERLGSQGYEKDTYRV